MSSKGGLRSQAREQAKNVRTSLRQELKLISTNREGFIIVQFLKIVDIIRSRQFMDEEKFKLMLKDYIEKNELPKRPVV